MWNRLENRTLHRAGAPRREVSKEDMYPDRLAGNVPPPRSYTTRSAGEPNDRTKVFQAICSTTDLAMSPDIWNDIAGQEHYVEMDTEIRLRSEETMHHPRFVG